MSVSIRGGGGWKGDVLQDNSEWMYAANGGPVLVPCVCLHGRRGGSMGIKRVREYSIAMGEAHLQLQWGKLLWSHLWIDHMYFFLTDSRSSKSTQDCAWKSGRLQHMIQWIPAKRGTCHRPRVHMRIPEGSLMR